MARQQRSTTFAQESTRPITQVALYARVSTLNNQDPEMQLSELREYAGRRGWHIVEEFTDQGVFSQVLQQLGHRGVETSGNYLQGDNPHFASCPARCLRCVPGSYPSEPGGRFASTLWAWTYWHREGSYLPPR